MNKAQIFPQVISFNIIVIPGAKFNRQFCSPNSKVASHRWKEMNFEIRGIQTSFFSWLAHWSKPWNGSGVCKTVNVLHHRIWDSAWDHVRGCSEVFVAIWPLSTLTLLAGCQQPSSSADHWCHWCKVWMQCNITLLILTLLSPTFHTFSTRTKIITKT